MRREAVSLATLLIVGGCNALTGASDLAVAAGDGTGAGAAEAGTPGDDGGALDASSSADALPPTCTAGEKICTGKVANECVGDSWKSTTCPDLCVNGACELHRSCKVSSLTGCGTPATSCCATETVTGGTFLRANDQAYPATVSTFELDKFEVTVGRFRAFMAVGGAATQQNPPAPGAGAHPKIPGSGWDPGWNEQLPSSTSALQDDLQNGTWTQAPGANENKPITRVSWLVAFAFCAWDGGRLPTYAEWSLAAAGGAEQRVYPWAVPPSTAISSANAAYNCAYSPPSRSCTPAHCSTGLNNPCGLACAAPAICIPLSCTGCDNVLDVAPVGALTAGVGRWGHFDLSGNVAEYVVDIDDGALPVPCVDCARVVGNKVDKRLVAGGGFDDPADSVRATSRRSQNFDDRDATLGFRCAR